MLRILSIASKILTIFWKFTSNNFELCFDIVDLDAVIVVFELLVSMRGGVNGFGDEIFDVFFQRQAD